MTTFVEFAARGKTAWWRYLLAAVLAIVGWFGAILALGVVALVLSVNVGGALATPSHPVPYFLATGLVFGALVLTVWGACRLVQSKRFTDLIGAWRWSLVATGALLWLGVQAAATLIDFLIAPHAFTVTASSATFGLALAALAGIGVQTFSEEFIFRGFVTQGLVLGFRALSGMAARDDRPAWQARVLKRPEVAALVSGLLFGALHIPNGWPQAASATAFGIATALIAIRTGGLAFTWGMHVVNNLFGSILVVSAGDVFKGAPGVLTQNSPGLNWWDAVVGVVALGIALVFVMRRWRAPPDAPIASAAADVFA